MEPILHESAIINSDNRNNDPISTLKTKCRNKCTSFQKQKQQVLLEGDSFELSSDLKQSISFMKDANGFMKDANGFMEFAWYCISFHWSTFKDILHEKQQQLVAPIEIRYQQKIINVQTVQHNGPKSKCWTSMPQSVHKPNMRIIVENIKFIVQYFVSNTWPEPRI